MFCTSCGNQLSEADRFCPECGTQTPKGAAEQPRPAPGPRRPLVRVMRGKMIGGVCAGFAQYLDMDITLVRVLWLCVALLLGAGFIAYLVCWIVMPRDDAPTVSNPPPPPAPASGAGSAAPPNAGSQ